MATVARDAALPAIRRPLGNLPARGRLGVLLVGLGAVSTTFIAGVMAVRRGLAEPVGSLTQMGSLDPDAPPGRRLSDALPLAGLPDLVFGAWDIFPDTAYEAAQTAAVLDDGLLRQLRGELEAIRPWPAVFDRRYVRRLDGPHVKQAPGHRQRVAALRADIARFREQQGVGRLVMIWCGSTEIFMAPGPVHGSVAAFEAALDDDDPAISPSMLYAYAALQERIPFANAAPNLTVDTGALLELASRLQVPVAGKDLKTGQTLLKTIIAPGLKARLLGVSGWYSTNILGNRDGEVLDDPGSFRTKEASKRGVLDQILGAGSHPELYGRLCHMVRISYYPPRGDNKEGWDNIDLFGWLGYPMQLKINFLCRDSILAAPLVLDLVLLLDLAARARWSGMQAWLSFFFKSPMHPAGTAPEHSLLAQLDTLRRTLGELAGAGLPAEERVQPR